MLIVSGGDVIEYAIPEKPELSGVLDIRERSRPACVFLSSLLYVKPSRARPMYQCGVCDSAGAAPWPAAPWSRGPVVRARAGPQRHTYHARAHSRFVRGASCPAFLFGSSFDEHKLRNTFVFRLKCCIFLLTLMICDLPH